MSLSSSRSVELESDVELSELDKNRSSHSMNYVLGLQVGMCN